jgi:hypothetical protein
MRGPAVWLDPTDAMYGSFDAYSAISSPITVLGSPGIRRGPVPGLAWACWVAGGVLTVTGFLLYVQVKGRMTEGRCKATIGSLGRDCGFVLTFLGAG